MSLTAAELLVRVQADIRDAQRDLQAVGAGLKAVGEAAQAAAGQVDGAAGKIDQSAKRARGSLETLADSQLFRSIGRGMETAGAAVVGALGVAAKTAGDFDQAMRNVSAVGHLTEDAFQSMSRGVLAISSDSGIRQGPLDLAKALYDVVSSGHSGADALGLVKVAAVGAAAGMTDTKTAAGALLAIMNSHIAGVTSAKQAMDVLFAEVATGKNTFAQLASAIGPVLGIASSLGVSLQEVTAAFATLTNKGLTAAQAGTSIASMLMHINKPSKEARTEMQELGISFGSAALQAKGLSGWLAEAIEKTHGDKQALTALLPEKRALVGLLKLADDNGKMYVERLDRMIHATDGLGESTRAQNEQNKGALAQWQIVRKELEILGIKLGTDLLPLMKQITGVLTDWLEKFNRLSPAVQKHVAQTAEWVGGLTLAIGVTMRFASAIAGLVGAYRALATAQAAAGGASALSGGAGAAGAAGGGGGLFGAGLLGAGMALAPRAGDAAYDAIRHLFGMGGPSSADLNAKVSQGRGQIWDWIKGLFGAGSSLSKNASANVEGLTGPALWRLQNLEEFLKGEGMNGVITSARDGHAGVHSAHNAGRAVDLVVPGQNMASLTALLKEAGFDASFERKGQVNANGSVATGDHIHILLAGAVSEGAEKGVLAGLAGVHAFGVNGPPIQSPDPAKKAKKSKADPLARQETHFAETLDGLEQQIQDALGLTGTRSDQMAKLKLQMPLLTENQLSAIVDATATLKAIRDQRGTTVEENPEWAQARKRFAADLAGTNWEIQQMSGLGPLNVPAVSDLDRVRHDYPGVPDAQLQQLMAKQRQAYLMEQAPTFAFAALGALGTANTMAGLGGRMADQPNEGMTAPEMGLLNAAITAAQTAVMVLTLKMEQFHQTVRIVAADTKQVFQGAFTDLATHGFKGFFASVIAGFKQMLVQMAADYLSSKLVALLFGADGGGKSDSGGLLGGILGSIFSATLGGGGDGGSSFSSNPNVSGTGFLSAFGGARAGGGSVAGGKAYLVGENGPEMFVPSGGGAIVPNHAMAGPTIVFNVQTPDVNSFQRSQAQLYQDAYRHAQLHGKRSG